MLQDWQLLAPRSAMEQTIQWLKDTTGKADAHAAARLFFACCANA